MRRQNLAQVGVDALDQLLIGNGRRVAARELGSEVVGIPIVLPAVHRGVLLSEIAPLRPDRVGEVQGQLLVVHGDAVPQTAKHSDQVVVQQQRVERVGDPAVD